MNSSNCFRIKEETHLLVERWVSERTSRLTSSIIAGLVNVLTLTAAVAGPTPFIESEDIGFALHVRHTHRVRTVSRERSPNQNFPLNGPRASDGETHA